MKIRALARAGALTAVMGIAGSCTPVEEELCGAPARLDETITTSVADERRTIRRDGQLTESNGRSLALTSIRIEALDGRLLALDEQPPSGLAPVGSVARSVIVVWDDDARLSEAAVLHLDGRGTPLGAWQMEMTWSEDGQPERIEAVGTPVPGEEIQGAIGTIHPGLSEGRLGWMPPLPGADLLGPLPADIAALNRARPPASVTAMSADLTPIEGGLRAEWTYGGNDLQQTAIVEHVETPTGWIRTWPGEDDVRTISVQWEAGERPGDGRLGFQLDGAVYEMHIIETTDLDEGTQRVHSIFAENVLVYRQERDETDGRIEERTDRDGDGALDQIVLIESRGDETIEVVDIAPLGPVDVYRRTRVDDTRTTRQSLSPASGRQLCTADGAAVTLAGEDGTRVVAGIPAELRD